jgi:hypothetical protein
MPRHLKWRLSIFNVSALFLVGCYGVLLTIAHFLVLVIERMLALTAMALMNYQVMACRSIDDRGLISLDLLVLIRCARSLNLSLTEW